MTTIFGMKYPQIDYVALAADRQTTLRTKDGQPIEKYLSRKLWRDKTQSFCFGHAGLLDNEIAEFINDLVANKYDIQKIVEKGNFEELRKVNIKKMGSKLPDPEKMFSLVLATRFEDKPKLYTCFPLGSVEERFWTTVGSGSQKVQEYMSALEIVSTARDYAARKDPFSEEDLIQTSLEAVRWSQSRDIYSSGLDLMICTPKRIDDYFNELGDDFSNKLKKISKSYKVK